MSSQSSLKQPEQSRTATLARGALPYLGFVVLLLTGWRVWDLAHALPAYDDVLEVLWTLRWYDGALRGQHDFLLYPLAFYPTGWHVATFAGGPFLFVVLLPLYWLGGAAFAYNVVTLLTFLVSFAGMLKLARLFVPTLAATLAALLFTFWGFHWFRTIGHMNVMLATAALPWMAWALERGLGAITRRTRWLVDVYKRQGVSSSSSWWRRASRLSCSTISIKAISKPSIRKPFLSRATWPIGRQSTR